jgi:hypothetical protein
VYDKEENLTTLVETATGQIITQISGRYSGNWQQYRAIASKFG